MEKSMVIGLNYLVCEIDMYKEFYINKDMFDLIEYPDDSTFYDLKNKKVIGKMKVETKGVVIADFVRLKSKMYWYIKEDNEGEEKAKEIVKRIYFRKETNEAQNEKYTK